MDNPDMALSLLVLLVGALVVLTILLKSAFARLGLPPLVAYLTLGFCMRLADHRWGFLDANGENLFEFLALVGLIALLFRAGLESNLRELLRQLKASSVIWVCDVLVSGFVGFVVTYYVLGFSLVPSIVAATALTATSVGIPVVIWRQKGALNTPNGERFIDVAELDDISGVILMGLLFTLLPLLREHEGGVMLSVLKTGGYFIAVLLGFVLASYVFSRFAEERITSFLERIQPAPDATIGVVGMSFVIAAIAALVGFSAAIGAFFAGLIFSRDPDRVHFDANFDSIYELFTPFFFINIGLTMAPDAMGGAVFVGGVLLLAATVGKLLGPGLPSLPNGFHNALVLAISMVPRAEIAMVVMKRGHELGPEVVPDRLFSGMVLVSAATCTVAPIVLQRVLKDQNQEEANAS